MKTKAEISAFMAEIGRKGGRVGVPVVLSDETVGWDAPWREQDEGGVYFLQVEQFVKIGFARAVKQRHWNIQHAVPFHVTPLGYIPCLSASEAQQLETELHQRFASVRVRGEWFDLTEEIRDVIANCASAWPPFRGRHPAKVS